MTSFVNIHYPQEHPGVVRAEAVIAAAGRLRQGFDGTRGIAALVLAAVVSALLVVADQLVDLWTGGRLLLAWAILWAVAFAALALFAGTARRIAVGLVQRADAWSSRVARDRADARLWATAQSDERVMADLRAAIARSDVTAPRVAAQALRTEQAPTRRSLRQMVLEWQADVQRARADVAYRMAVDADPRMRADLQAARGRAEVADVPAETQTLLRAERAGGSRHAFALM